MTIPDDIVVLSEPGPQLFTYPEWANYAVVTVQAGTNDFPRYGALEVRT